MADEDSRLARRGVLFVSLSALCFAGMGLAVKALHGTIPVFELAFFRSALAIPVLSYLLARRGESVRSARWRPLVLRGIWGVLAMVCYLHAIETLLLADAVVLNYSSPAFAALLGFLVLRETPGPRVLAAAALVACGVIAIARPTFDASALDLSIALGAGLFSGAAYATVRHLRGTESSLRIVWWFNAVASVVTLPLALLTGRWLTLGELAALAGIAALGTLGQVLMTFGFGHGPIARTTLPTVLVLAFSAFGAWTIWGEEVAGWSWFGMALVLAGVVAASAERGPAPAVSVGGAAKTDADCPP